MLNIIKSTLRLETEKNINSLVPWEIENHKKYKGIVLSRENHKRDNYLTIGFMGSMFSFAKEENIKFKLNTVNISKIVTRYEGFNKVIYDTDKVDYLFSFTVSEEKKFKIKIPYMTSESKIYIYDIEVTRLKQMYPITWDKIYIINLKRREDRKKQVLEQLTKHDIKDYEFVEAVDGQDPDIQKIYRRLREKSSPTDIGAVGHFGCLLSHEKVYKKALKDKVNSFMVLEDDIILKDNFLERINKIQVPDWECIYLGAPLEQKKLFYNGWVKHNKFSTTHGMIIKSSIIKYLLETIGEYDDYIDVKYSHTLQKDKKTYLLNDVLLTENESTDTSKKNEKFIYMTNNFYKELD